MEFKPVDLLEFYQNAGWYTFVNEGDMEGQLATCAQYAYVAGCGAVDAEVRYEQAVKARETKEGQLMKEIMKDETGKKWKSVSELKLTFRDNKDWIDLKEVELLKYATHKKMVKLANAFEIKSKMLMSLNRRQLAKIEAGIREEKKQGR